MDLLMGMFFSGMCCRGNKMWGFKIKNKSEDMVMQNHAAGVTAQTKDFSKIERLWRERNRGKQSSRLQRCATYIKNIASRYPLFFKNITKYHLTAISAIHLLPTQPPLPKIPTKPLPPLTDEDGLHLIGPISVVPIGDLELAQHEINSTCLKLGSTCMHHPGERYTFGG